MKTLFLLIFSFVAFSQNRISGILTDIDTNQKIENITIRLNGMVHHAKTNKDGYFLLENLPLGKTQLVILANNYQVFKQSVLVEQNNKIDLIIKLKKTVLSPETSSLGITDYQKGLILGNSKFNKLCKILNETAITVSEKEGRLVFNSNQPILIENRALGYFMCYDLDSKMTFYEELKPYNQKELKTWEDNRKQAYLKSERRFLKSLISGQLSKSGYQVQQDSLPINDTNKDLLLAISGSIYSSTLFFNKPIKVVFKHQNAIITNTIKQIKTRSEVNFDGFLADKDALQIDGDWSQQKLAESLPREYGYQELFQTEIPAVYLHTNKSVYTAGEKIWLSAYIVDRSSNHLVPDRQPLYVELYNATGKKIQEQMYFTNTGRGFGNILISEKYPAGVYRIRAFTKPMLNAPESVFEKTFIIQNIRENVKIINKNPQIFAKTTPSLKFSIETNNFNFEKREKVNLKIKVIDDNDKPVKGTFSITVSDEKLSFDSSNEINMADYIAASQPIISENKGYYLENTLHLSGTAIHKDSKKPIINGEVILIVMDSSKLQTSRVFKTNEFGNFRILDLELTGTKTISYQVNDSKGKPDFDGIITFDNINPDNTISAIDFEKIDLDPAYKTALLKNIQKPDGEAFKVPENDILLDEIQVKEKKIEEEYSLVGINKLYETPTHSKTFELNKPVYTSVGDMLAQVPGAALMRGVGSIGSGNLPLYVVDGDIVENPLAMLSPMDVYKIDIISDGMAGGMYGMRSANGVILFYTRRHNQRSNSIPFTKTLVFSGLQEDIPFYTPDYSTSKPSNSDPDFRLNLYWNPEIITDENGDATISFFTGDRIGTFKMIIEGMTNGKIGSYSQSIFVR